MAKCLSEETKKQIDLGHQPRCVTTCRASEIICHAQAPVLSISQCSGHEPKYRSRDELARQGHITGHCHCSDHLPRFLACPQRTDVQRLACVLPNCIDAGAQTITGRGFPSFLLSGSVLLLPSSSIHSTFYVAHAPQQGSNTFRYSIHPIMPTGPFQLHFRLSRALALISPHFSFPSHAAATQPPSSLLSRISCPTSPVSIFSSSPHHRAFSPSLSHSLPIVVGSAAGHSLCYRLFASRRDIRILSRSVASIPSSRPAI